MQKFTEQEVVKTADYDCEKMFSYKRSIRVILAKRLFYATYKILCLGAGLCIFAMC
jgi:hypothetical protein